MAKVSKEKMMMTPEMAEKIDYDNCYCGVCDKTFKNLGGLKGHVLYKHTGYKKSSNLTHKQKSERLAELFLNNMKVAKDKQLNKSELMKLAGYTRSSVAKSGHRAFSTETFKEALARRGVTGESIIKTAQEAQEATQGSWFKGEYFKSKDPDHSVRIKGASLLADVTGIKSQTHKVESINVNMDGEDFRELLDLS